ncbi:low-density lipoprotein receptor-related protein 5-like protein [Antedon mediterranea]|uniref:low-density lipoprotein receptor-related protein 5-like protein n=1 Tax=Antedon mediterranea TaxID=105859 RepID=UPI003AF4AFE1
MGKKTKLYWTNSAESKIEAVNTDGTNKTVLFDTNLDTPLAIEVDTINGIRYLYWSNCGNTVQNIERAPLDDLSKRTQIVTGGLVYPSGIALSVSNGKMYWCDSGTDVIEEANLDGTERRIIANLTGHPSDIEVYKNYLYWTDWTGGIHRLDRMTGIQSIESSDSRLIQTGPLYVGPFKVQDDCGGCMNNGTCVSTEDDISTCTCPNGYMGAICEIVVGYCPCALP